MEKRERERECSSIPRTAVRRGRAYERVEVRGCTWMSGGACGCAWLLRAVQHEKASSRTRVSNSLSAVSSLRCQPLSVLHLAGTDVAVHRRRYVLHPHGGHPLHAVHRRHLRYCVSGVFLRLLNHVLWGKSGEKKGYVQKYHESGKREGEGGEKGCRLIAQRNIPPLILRVVLKKRRKGGGRGKKRKREKRGKKRIEKKHSCAKRPSRRNTSSAQFAGLC